MNLAAIGQEVKECKAQIVAMRRDVRQMEERISKQIDQLQALIPQPQGSEKAEDMYDIMNSGKSFKIQGDYDKAVNCFSRLLLRLHHNDVVTLWERSETYCWQNKFDLALDDLNLALKSDSNCKTHLFNNKAIIYYLQKEYDLALENCKLSLEHGSENFQTVAIQALVCIQRDELKDALSHLDNAIKINSNYTMGYCMRAEIYYTLKRVDDSFAELKWALGLKGLSFEEALKSLNEDLEKEPENETVLMYRGVIHLVQGNYNLAKKDFIKVTRPNTLAFHLCRVYFL